MEIGQNVKEKVIKVDLKHKKIGLSIVKAVKEAEAFAAEDKKKKEEVDTRNQADQMVFQCEKSLGEFGDKISADEKSSVQAKIDALKEALKGTDIEAIKAKQKELETEFQGIATKVYQQAAQAQQAAGAQAGPDMGSDGASQDNNDDVIDAEFSDAE